MFTPKYVHLSVYTYSIMKLFPNYFADFPVLNTKPDRNSGKNLKQKESETFYLDRRKRQKKRKKTKKDKRQKRKIKLKKN